MRVLITGGTGTIGLALTQSLAADGHEVIVLSRSPRASVALPAGARIESWDAQTAQGWGQWADGADAIVNLAGENIGAGRWSAERKQRILQSRLQSGAALVEAIHQAQRKPQVLIQASAVGYYGSTYRSERLTEQLPAGTDFLADVCVQWEASTLAVEKLGVRRPIIRTGVVLTPTDGALQRMMVPFRFYVGGPIGEGQQQFPWIHLQDEVRAIRFLLEHNEAAGPFNLTAPNPVTNAEFSRALGKAMGRPSLMPVPAFAMRLLFAEMAVLLLEGQRAVPVRLLDLGFEFAFPTLSAALQDLLQ